jgi:flagellar hook-associated protein 3 FlgL
MTIGTPRLHQQNVELFARLNQELKSLQGQVGSGKADLKLSENLYDISKLSAAEERKSETNQYMQHAKRATKDLEFLDVALDRLQNLTVNLQELVVDSSSDMLSQTERERFILDAQSLKKEIFDLANQNDSFGNSLFGGHSGTKNPFVMDNNGSVSYVGSALKREVKVSPSLYVQQNVAGNELFNNISDGAEKTSIFQLVDDFIFSLENDLNSGYSSNLLSDGDSVDLVFPSSGAEADFEFVLKTGNTENKIEATIYGNDYSQIVDQINTLTGSTGISASTVSGNRIRLQGSVEQLNISNFDASNFVSEKSYIGVIKDISSSDVVERINDNRLQIASINDKIKDAFEQFSTARAQVGASSRIAQDNEAAAQDVLVTLEEDMSKIRDADLASLLTQLEFLMTNKEAAQATFTRITSKSLFDFLG